MHTLKYIIFILLTLFVFGCSSGVVYRPDVSCTSSRYDRMGRCLRMKQQSYNKYLIRKEAARSIYESRRSSYRSSGRR